MKKGNNQTRRHETNILNINEVFQEGTWQENIIQTYREDKKRQKRRQNVICYNGGKQKHRNLKFTGSKPNITKLENHKVKNRKQRLDDVLNSLAE